MTVLSHLQPANDVGLDLDVPEEIQRRVLWLAVRMVDHANNDRPSGEVKVGGHQASSASIVGIMTSLWFGHLGPDDKVVAKPQVSPVLHSLNYLIGALDGSYLTLPPGTRWAPGVPEPNERPRRPRLLPRLRRARRRGAVVRGRGATLRRRGLRRDA